MNKNDPTTALGHFVPEESSANECSAQETAEAPESDGVPFLGGANPAYRPDSVSIFDLARGAR